MRKAVLILIALSFILGPAADTVQASVSSAAVLFLRIAAGARAAGMGEAFVAVADDATATHWNPAGLGMYPLSHKWVDITVPKKYRPLKKMALLKTGGELDYDSYDIWGLSPVGLLKYSKGKWFGGDILECGPRETAELKLRQYTGLVGETTEEKLAGLLDMLGRANNPYSKSRIDSLEFRVMSAVAGNEKQTGDFETIFGELKEAYNGCMIDWSMFDKAVNEFDKAVKKAAERVPDNVDEAIDSAGTVEMYMDARRKLDAAMAGEIDKVYFALKKAKRKYMPEEITVPFAINFDGEPVDFTAGVKFLWVSRKAFHLPGFAA